MSVSNRPDGFVGSILALESIEGVCTILHGPGGCRFRLMRLTNELNPSVNNGDSRFNKPYFFGNPLVPCTYLDEKDYIYGGSDKLAEALDVVSSMGDFSISVIESPATSLIGDDIGSVIRRSGLSDVVLYSRMNKISMPLPEGFDRTMTDVIGAVAERDVDKVDSTVALLGVPTFCTDWRTSVAEIERILRLMGLEVVVAPGAGSPLDSIRRIGSVEFSIGVFPEYCRRQQKELKQSFDVKPLVCPDAPIGFDAMESWILSVSEFTGKDPDAALSYLDTERSDVNATIRGDVRRADQIRGRTFAISGDLSVVSPLTEWLITYLNLVPVAVRIEEGSDEEDLERFVTKMHNLEFEDAIGQWDDPDCDYMLAPGDLAKMYSLNKPSTVDVDIGFPPSREFRLLPKTILGTTGSRYILDRILNG